MATAKVRKAALLARVRRISGQIAAIEKAISDDAPCEVVMHQVASVRGSVGGLMDEVISDHIHQHLAQPGIGNKKRAKAADEIIAAIRRYAN